MKQKCKHQVNNGWCKARGGVCIWTGYTESCLKREEVEPPSGIISKAYEYKQLFTNRKWI